jgi:hypothetical protein
MLYLLWIFTGMLVGLLLVSVFTPPNRKTLELPTPNSNNIFHTPTGCIRFRTQSVQCSDSASSLNLLASQHK